MGAGMDIHHTADVAMPLDRQGENTVGRRHPRLSGEGSLHADVVELRIDLQQRLHELAGDVDVLLRREPLRELVVDQ